jgi:alginate O-acetyltransferase complex protein AlgI
MLFSSPQYPLFLAAVFFLYGLARTGRWPASIARVALMLLLADVVYVLLTHDVGTLWDPIGGTVLAWITDTPAPAAWRWPLGLIVVGGAFRLGLELAGRHRAVPGAVAPVAPARAAAPRAVARKQGKGKKKGKRGPPARAAATVAAATVAVTGDPVAAERVSAWTGHALAGALVALGAIVLIGARTDTLGAFTSAFAHVGHLVYLIGVGFALGAAQTERGRHLGRVLILGLVSAVFYHAWAAGQHGAYQYLLALIAATIVLDFYLARAIEASERHGVRLALLIVSLVSNLGILAVFKYADFFRLDVLHTGGAPWKLILPAGISFHTFQSLSYTVDVYRREIRATRSVIELATFVLFFPQLVAGPIVRATELLPQLRDLPLFDHDRAADGLFRIVVGLAKKIAIADFLGDALADRVFANPELYSSVEVGAGVVAYAFQIYLDFSAYSDIAIGSAQLLGFTLPENFRTPYRSASLQEFWRRWHISLSSWLRDYLYIPLGGNRGGELTTYRNLIVTMLLGGLWHGASWTFIVWGLLHGGGLAVTRIYQRAARPRRVLAIAGAAFALGVGVEVLGLAPQRPWAHLAFAWAFTVPLWAALTAILEGLPAPTISRAAAADAGAVVAGGRRGAGRRRAGGARVGTERGGHPADHPDRGADLGRRRGRGRAVAGGGAALARVGGGARRGGRAGVRVRVPGVDLLPRAELRAGAGGAAPARRPRVRSPELDPRGADRAGGGGGRALVRAAHLRGAAPAVRRGAPDRAGAGAGSGGAGAARAGAPEDRAVHLLPVLTSSGLVAASPSPVEPGEARRAPPRDARREAHGASTGARPKIDERWGRGGVTTGRTAALPRKCVRSPSCP